MSSSHAVFHPLTIAAIEPLTDDSVAITFDVPDELREDYAFTQGQHITVLTELAGDQVRRNYSICTPVSSGTLRIAVKRLPGGAFSEHALDQLRPGDVIDVMTPSGRFFTELDPQNAKSYVCVAAGSGITPVLSIVATTLEVEPQSRVTLIYANRTHASVMFLEEVEDLKDRYPDRFQLIHVLSREPQEVELFSGRLDEDRDRVLGVVVCHLSQALQGVLGRRGVVDPLPWQGVPHQRIGVGRRRRVSLALAVDGILSLAFLACRHDHCRCIASGFVIGRASCSQPRYSAQSNDETLPHWQLLAT